MMAAHDLEVTAWQTGLFSWRLEGYNTADQLVGY